MLMQEYGMAGGQAGGHRHRPDGGRPRARAGLRAGAGDDRVPAGDPRALVARPPAAGDGRAALQHNARKQQVIREIYHRAFAAAGLLEP